MGNNFYEGEMGVLNLSFDGTQLGYTMEETSLERIEDLKEIKFAQLGTQPADLIPTGQGWRLTVKLGETTMAKLAKLIRGFTVVGNSAALTQDLYRSGYTHFAKRLVATRVDSDGNDSTDPHFRTTFFRAFPKVNGPVAGPFGPDTQRGTEVEFIIFYDRTRMGFGFTGHASSVGL